MSSNAVKLHFKNDASPKSVHPVLSNLVTGSSASLASPAPPTAFTKIANQSVQSKASHVSNSDLTSNGTGGSITNLSVQSSENNKRTASNTEARNKVFRHTISLIVDNNNPAFATSVSARHASVSSTLSLEDKTKMDHHTPVVLIRQQSNGSKNADTSGYDNMDDVDNINISVNLLNANNNNNNTLNNSSAFFDVAEPHLNSSLASSSLAYISNNNNNNNNNIHKKCDQQQAFASSDYENESMNSVTLTNNNTNANKVAFLDFYFQTA